MDFLEFLNFARRQFALVATIVLATVIAASAIYFLQKPVEKTTLLFSVGVDESSVSEKSFDATKLADDFADTIAGWLRSPTFGERVSGVAGESVAAGGAAQSTQNFLVELSFADASKKDVVVAATRQILDSELEKYDAKSKYKFFTTLHGESSASSLRSPGKIFAAAIFAAFVLAAILLVFSAYFGGRIHSVREAERIAKMRAAVIFSSPKKDDANFLRLLAKKSGNSVLVGLDFDPKKLATKLNLNLKSVEIPRALDKLSKNETKIVVARLDISRANSLRMLRSLAGDEKIQLVIWA